MQGSISRTTVTLPPKLFAQRLCPSNLLNLKMERIQRLLDDGDFPFTTDEKNVLVDSLQIHLAGLSPPCWKTLTGTFNLLTDGRQRRAFELQQLVLDLEQRGEWFDISLKSNVRAMCNNTLSHASLRDLPPTVRSVSVQTKTACAPY